MSLGRRDVTSTLLAVSGLLFACTTPEIERSAAPASSFGSPRTIEILVRSQALHLSPPRNADWTVHRLDRFGLPEPSPECGPPLYAVGPGSAAGLPSTTLAGRPAGYPTVPVVSLAVESCRLTRLHSNPGGTGRAWEEPGFVTVFANGEPVFGSGAGIRLHGNSSRFLVRKSYRVVARPTLGATGLPGQWVGLDEEQESQQWVLKRDAHRDGIGRRWYFALALGLDIAREMGALAPQAKTVSLLLNGEDEGVYALAERIDEHFLERSLGGRDWEISSEKIGRGTMPWLWRRLRSLEDGKTPQIPMERLEREADLDSLIRWHLALIFCITSDADQAVMARSSDGKWQWVVWDLDSSFRLTRPGGRSSWEVDRLEALDRLGWNNRSLTSLLIWTLLTTSEEFRDRYVQLGLEILERQLTPEFLRQRADHYETLTNELGIVDREFLSELGRFLEHRPDALRRQLTSMAERGLPGTP